MTGTATDLLTVARKQIGVKETGGGTKGNKQRYSVAMGMPTTEWCAIFISWCLREAHVPKAYAATRVTLFARHYSAEGHYFKTPRPGDLACFDWEGDGLYDHIGIVEQVLPDGRIQTIEGNTNPGNGQDGVYRMRRSTRLVKGYCRPDFAAIAAVQPTFHVVVQGDGLDKIAAHFGTTRSRLLALNPTITDPNLIHIGQRIRVR